LPVFPPPSGAYGPPRNPARKEKEWVMTARFPPPGVDGAIPQALAELGEVAQDWITLWQSELSALAMDREAQETWQALLALWAGAAGAMLSALPRTDPDGRNPAGSRTPGPTAASRPAPAAAAPDPRDAEIERLGRRVAELEQRLVELERRGG
jgi:hypothetical protein